MKLGSLIVLLGLVAVSVQPVMADTVTKQFTITINPKLDVPTQLPAVGIVGSPYVNDDGSQIVMQAVGGKPPYANWNDLDPNGQHTLPPGVTIDANSGAVSGIPTQACNPCSTILISVSDANGNKVTKPIAPTQPPASPNH